MQRSSMLFNILGAVGLVGLLSGCGSGGGGTTTSTGYNGSHGVTDFYYTVTVKVGGPSVTVLNSILDNSNRPMNVSIERLEVNGDSLSPSDFGVSSLAVGTAGGAPACP